VYPEKPNTGIRATHPNEYCHIDVTVVADSGVENVNAGVDQLMDDGVIRRVLAQVEVSFSNSMIEAFWRSLRHQWLYLHSLESFTQLEQLVDFYVREHNTQLPHYAFDGQTPDEVYFDQADRFHYRLGERSPCRNVDGTGLSYNILCPGINDPTKSTYRRVSRGLWRTFRSADALPIDKRHSIDGRIS